MLKVVLKCKCIQPVKGTDRGWQEGTRGTRGHAGSTALGTTRIAESASEAMGEMQSRGRSKGHSRGRRGQEA